MSEFKVGDEIYRIDIIFRRCKISDAYGRKTIIPLDREEDNKEFVFIDYKNEAIDAIIKYLERLRDE